MPRLWALMAILCILLAVPLVLLFTMPRLLAAEGLDAISYNLVVEAYREQLTLIKWAATGASGAAVTALGFLIKELIQSKAATLAEVKAAASARFEDQKERIKEHELTRAEISKLPEEIAKRLVGLLK